MRLRLTAPCCSRPQKSLGSNLKGACTTALLLSVLLLQPACCSPANATLTTHDPDQPRQSTLQQAHAAASFSDVQLKPQLHGSSHQSQGCKGPTRGRSLSEEDASQGRAAAGQHSDGRDKSRSTRSSRAHLRAASGMMASRTGALVPLNVLSGNLRNMPHTLQISLDMRQAQICCCSAWSCETGLAITCGWAGILLSDICPGNLHSSHSLSSYLVLRA